MAVSWESVQETTKASEDGRAETNWESVMGEGLASPVLRTISCESEMEGLLSKRGEVSPSKDQSLIGEGDTPSMGE
jgi:nitroimidazol reductase NimA-like FMN-containing flavoprotein (pyridoxamine 5'-phosphate oxidase superfamily)